MSQEFSRNHTLQALECSKVRQTFTCYPHFIQIHKIGLWDKFSRRYHWFRNSCDKSLVTSVSASRKLRELEIDPTGFAPQSVVHEALVNQSGSPSSWVFFDFEIDLSKIDLKICHMSFWLHNLQMWCIYAKTNDGCLITHQKNISNYFSDW